MSNVDRGNLIARARVTSTPRCGVNTSQNFLGYPECMIITDLLFACIWPNRKGQFGHIQRHNQSRHEETRRAPQSDPRCKVQAQKTGQCRCSRSPPSPAPHPTSTSTFFQRLNRIVRIIRFLIANFFLCIEYSYLNARSPIVVTVDGAGIWRE